MNPSGPRLHSERASVTCRNSRTSRPLAAGSPGVSVAPHAWHRCNSGRAAARFRCFASNMGINRTSEVRSPLFPPRAPALGCPSLRRASFNRPGWPAADPCGLPANITFSLSLSLLASVLTRLTPLSQRTLLAGFGFCASRQSFETKMNSSGLISPYLLSASSLHLPTFPVHRARPYLRLLHRFRLLVLRALGLDSPLGAAPPGSLQSALPLRRARRSARQLLVLFDRGVLWPGVVLRPHRAADRAIQKKKRTTNNKRSAMGSKAQRASTCRQRSCAGEEARVDEAKPCRERGRRETEWAGARACASSGSAEDSRASGEDQRPRKAGAAAGGNSLCFVVALLQHRYRPTQPGAAEAASGPAEPAGAARKASRPELSGSS